MIKKGQIYICVKEHSCERLQWSYGDSIEILYDITGIILDLKERNYFCKIVVNGKEHRVTKLDSEILSDNFITLADFRNLKIDSILC